MNVQQRKDLLPLDEVEYPLSDVLRTILLETLHTARQYKEISGQMRAIRDGFAKWRMAVAATLQTSPRMDSMFVRGIAISMPEHFVVAMEHNVFQNYRLTSQERLVLEACQKDFDEQVAMTRRVHAAQAVASKSNDPKDFGGRNLVVARR